MAKIAVEVDLDDYIAGAASDMGEYGEKPAKLEDFIINKLSKNILDSMSVNVRQEVCKAVETRFKDAVDAGVTEFIEKVLERFLTTEIVLSDEWGRPNFFGTYEDMMLKKFDEKLLYPVDSQGKKVLGCTTSGKTYVEYLVESKIDSIISRIEDKFEKQVATLGKPVKTEVLKR